MFGYVLVYDQDSRTQLLSFLQESHPLFPLPSNKSDQLLNGLKSRDLSGGDLNCLRGCVYVFFPLSQFECGAETNIRVFPQVCAVCVPNSPVSNCADKIRSALQTLFGGDSFFLAVDVSCRSAMLTG